MRDLPAPPEWQGFAPPGARGVTRPTDRKRLGLLAWPVQASRRSGVARLLRRKQSPDTQAAKAQGCDTHYRGTSSSRRAGGGERSRYTPAGKECRTFCENVAKRSPDAPPIAAGAERSGATPAIWEGQARAGEAEHALGVGITRESQALHQGWRGEALGAVGADVDGRDDFPDHLALAGDLEDAVRHFAVLHGSCHQDIAVF